MKKKRLRKSFKRKVTINSVLIATLPVLILGLFLIVFLQKQTQFVIEQKIEDSLIAVNKRFDSELTQYHEMIYNIESEFKQSQNELQMLTKLYQFIGPHYEFIKLSILSEDGNLQMSTRKIPDTYQLPKYKNWGIFRELSKSSEVIYYPNVNKDEDFKNSFTIAHQFEHNDKLYYALIDFSTEYFQNLILDYKHQGFGTQQFIFVGPGKEVLYNDSQYTNAITFYDQIFVENRFSPTNFRLEEGELLFTEGIINEKTHIEIIGLMPNVYLRNQAQVNTLLISLLVFVAIIVGSLFGVKLGKQITDPILALARNLKRTDQDNIDYLELEERQDEIGYIAQEIESLFARLNESYNKNLEQAELLKTSEIKALMSQMNPHFLYNTLETIKWNARFSGNQEIEDIVTELGYLLHETMNQSETLISVERELEFIKNYINIQKRRYGDKFEFVLNIQEELLPYKIPKFLLQPLIENALIHGIEPKDDSGIIELNAWLDEKFLYFSVADDGVGSEENIAQLDSDHIGIRNINHRIKLHYGPEYTLDWQSSPKEGTVVYIKIPYQKGGEDHV